MIIITTSRNPNPRTRTFCNALRGVIPDSIRLNRGTSGLKQLIIKANELYADFIIIIDSRQGNPSRIRFFYPTGTKGEFHPLELYIHGIAINQKQSKRRFVDETYKLKIRTSKPDKKYETLGKSLAEIFDTDFAIIKRPSESELKADISSSKKKKREKIIYMFIEEIKDKINLLFCKDDYLLIGPRIILRDYKFKPVKKK